MRSYLKVFFSFEEETKELNDAERGSLLLAMLRYAETGEVPALTGNERFLFPVFKNMIDRDVEIYNVKVSNGSKGGRPVSNKKAEETEENLMKPNETEENQEESEKTETAKTKIKIKDKDKRLKNKNTNELLFARFWSAYPRKEAKQNALRAFEKINPDEELLSLMLEAIEKQKRSEQWQEDGGRFIPHPTTWLNGRRWEDQLPEAKPKPGYGGYSQRSYADQDESMESVLARLRG